MAYFTALADRFPLVTYPRGRVIIGQHDVGSGIWCIEHGLIKVSVFAAGGSERIFDLLGVGCILGEPSLFGGMIFGATATAIEDTTCISIPVADARDLVARDSGFSLLVVNSLTRKLRRRGRQLTHAAFGDARRQVAGALVYLADDRRRGCRDAVRTTHEELAHLLGLSRVTVANALARLEGEGIVARRNRYVLVVDLDGLLQAACEDGDAG